MVHVWPLRGNSPLSGGPWSIDYMVGVAGLFGSESATQTASVAGACISGCPTAATSSSNNVVFNADAMLGLAYAVTPSSKLALNYRADYYSNAMRTLSSTGVGSNTSRTPIRVQICVGRPNSDCLAIWIENPRRTEMVARVLFLCIPREPSHIAPSRPSRVSVRDVCF